ncbi:hypothetical protein D9758_019030 [Tetrapyrgos nigripes]|uniref:Uncharacterized protein n=1 Tax=Tetrapyrgos nigripes TaxID=182062 RepID=A0A8H5B0E7_9AGAR|nr:hypothetical protein D9758_019030 [Tetrapyrgos nigripes]
MTPFTFTTNSKTPKSKNGKYKLRALLAGHQGAVACVTAHPLGSHVASGGREGTLVWKLQDKKLLGSPTGAGDQGVALAWMIRPDDTDDGLFTEVYCNHLEGRENGEEITAIAFDTSSSQLAVVHLAEIVHRFVVDPLMRLTTVKSTRIKNHWPQAVGFGQTAAHGPEIWSFGREHILDEGGKITVTKTTGVVIGGAAISVKDNAYILDDMSQGVALYKLSGAERLKTFAVTTNERRSRNVGFHDRGKALISGSDHGDVYIFDRRTGEVNDIIQVGCKDWVQSITEQTTEMEGVPIIIIGRSGENLGQTALQVWERERENARGDSCKTSTGGRPSKQGAREWMEIVTGLDLGIESVADRDIDTRNVCSFIHLSVIAAHLVPILSPFTMSSTSKYSVKDLIKDPSILTLFAKPGTHMFCHHFPWMCNANQTIALKSFDGLCGNHVGEVLVSTPNMSTLYCPPLNQCSVRMRRDGHFGPDDPLYFPQPFHRPTAHLAVIRAPQPSPDHPFAVAWIILNDSHFELSTQTFCVGFGFLDRRLRSKLVALSDTVFKSIPHGQEDDPYIRSSREHLCRLMDRLNLSAPMDDLFLRFQCAQRHLLELDARIQWIKTFRERYGATPSVDHPSMADASLVGAFTDDLDVLENLFQCQIPVYYVRILSRAGNARIDKLQQFLPLNQKSQLHSGFEVDLSDKVPLHRVIFTGLAQNPERYVTMVNYVISLLDYPSPLGNSTPQSSTSMQKASLPFKSTLPTRSTSSASQGRYAPYTRGGKAKQLADSSNNTFMTPSSPVMPQSIDNWRIALEELATHNQSLAAPEGVNRGYALPPADLFVTTGNPSTAATLFRNYLKLKDIFIYRLSYSSKRYSKKQWRQLLTIDKEQEIRADTRTGKQRLEMQTLLKSMVSRNTVQFDQLSSVPVTWRGETIDGIQVPPTIAKEIIWELYELNFQQDLVALDAQLDKSNMSLPERQNLLDRCWIGAREYTDCQKVQDGLASTDPTKRSQILGALHKIMTTWHGPKPPVLLSGFPVDMSGHNFGTRLDQIERDLAFYYTSSFLNVFFRAASIPYRL